MQTYEGYFEQGRFVPFGVASIPKNKRAIVTILDEPAQAMIIPDDVCRKLKELDDLNAMVDASIGEEVPPFERVNLHREAEL